MIKWGNYLLIVLCIFGVLFYSTNLFIEEKSLGKWYIFISFTLIATLTNLLFTKRLLVDFDILTVILSVFIGYILVRAFFSPAADIRILLPVCFLLLFFLLKIDDKGYSGFINAVIVVGCLAQSAYGIMQFVGVASGYSVYGMNGSFDNPAGFAACLSASIPFCLTLTGKNRYLNMLGYFSILVIAISLVLSGSRAGISSLVIVLALFFYGKYKHVFKNRSRLLVVSFVLFFSLGFALFFLKKDSALGRILIWKTSRNMIADEPFWGSGRNTFLSKYMLYQANYFENNPESSYSALADNVSHPFSEYLFLIAEYGMFGFALLLIIGFILSFRIKNIDRIDDPYLLCLLSISIFAIFSYPLRYPFILVLLSYCLARLSNFDEILFSLRINNTVKIGMILLFAFGFLTVYKDIDFEYRWKKLVRLTTLGKTEETLNGYAELYTLWNHDPYFLYNYGSVLNSIENYRASNDIMSECESYFNDYDIQMLIADNHLNMNELMEAEARYTLASKMCPNRFMPLYKLFGIYRDSNDQEEASRIAEKIISKPVKIPSAIVNHIKTETMSWMNEEKFVILPDTK